MSISLGYVIFYVPDVAASVAFYTAAFDLEAKFVTDEGDYGEVATGDTTLAFVRHDLAESNLESAGGYTRLDATPSPVGASITLVIDDVSAAVKAAVDAGGRIYVEPTEKPWGQTVAYLIDPAEILIEIATPVSGGFAG